MTDLQLRARKAELLPTSEYAKSTLRADGHYPQGSDYQMHLFLDLPWMKFSRSSDLMFW